MKINHSAVKILFLISFAVLFYFLLRPRTTSFSNDPDVYAYRSVTKIGNAMRQYATDHEGRLPSLLSDLVPNYVAVSNINWFIHEKYSMDIHGSVTSNRSELGWLIDLNGRFVYLGEFGKKVDVVLYDRPKFWPSDASVNEIVTMTAELLARLRNTSDLTNRIGK
jgi:hypothetical protein